MGYKSEIDKKIHNRAYYQKNKKKINEKVREWYYSKRDTPEYKEKMRLKMQRYRILYPDGIKKRDAMRRRRLKVMQLLGGAFCKKCGFEDARALQFDHIFGGGTEERKKMGAQQSKIIINIENNPSKFQVLCANCNWIKRVATQEDLLRFKRARKLEEYQKNEVNKKL